MSNEVRNPAFVFGVSVSGSNFIGREAEIRQLKMNFEEGINTVLISPRRWGKTSLVKRVCEVVDRNRVLPVYLDIFKCKSEYEFYNALAEAVLSQTATRTEQLLDNAREFLLRLMPKISFSPEPLTEFSLSLGITPHTHSPEEVLQLAQTVAERRGRRIVVCIDEFQQIGEMDSSVDIQKRLRSVWQHQTMVSYCLFGSKKHTMMTAFQQRNMPLYQFGDFMYLQKIPTALWVDYITSHFARRRRSISAECAEAICTAVDNYSSYVQQLAWIVFSLIDEDETATADHVNRGIELLIDSQEQLFMQQIEPLSVYQMNMLRCIVAGHHSGFGEAQLRHEFNLGSASNIARLRTALINRDLVEATGGDLHLTDPVFARWFTARRL